MTNHPNRSKAPKTYPVIISRGRQTPPFGLRENYEWREIVNCGTRRDLIEVVTEWCAGRKTDDLHYFRARQYETRPNNPPGDPHDQIDSALFTIVDGRANVYTRGGVP